MGKYKCEDCDYNTERKLNYDRHLDSPLHKKRKAGIKGLYRCIACVPDKPLIMEDTPNLIRHLKSIEHKKNVIKNFPQTTSSIGVLNLHERCKYIQKVVDGEYSPYSEAIKAAKPKLVREKKGPGSSKKTDDHECMREDE